MRCATPSRSRPRASSCAPTCSGSSAASTPPFRSTATTSTCAGVRTSVAPAWWWCPRPAAATASMLAERRPELPHAALAARSRMRSVATLTGARRLPLVSLQLVLITLAETIVGVLTGRFRQVGATLMSLLAWCRAPRPISPAGGRCCRCGRCPTRRLPACSCAVAPASPTICARVRAARRTLTAPPSGVGGRPQGRRRPSPGWPSASSPSSEVATSSPMACLASVSSSPSRTARATSSPTTSPGGRGRGWAAPARCPPVLPSWLSAAPAPCSTWACCTPCRWSACCSWATSGCGAWPRCSPPHVRVWRRWWCTPRCRSLRRCWPVDAGQRWPASPPPPGRCTICVAWPASRPRECASTKRSSTTSRCPPASLFGSVPSWCCSWVSPWRSRRRSPCCSSH
jgi:hypothetical protein